MEDVLEVYTRPYDPQRPGRLPGRDEQAAARRHARSPCPHGPGSPSACDYEYERSGVANLFLFCEPLAGLALGGRDRAAHQGRLGASDPGPGRRAATRDAERIVLVMDNLNTHTPGLASTRPSRPAEAKRLADKLEIHYTPKHGSWLNMAEIELSVLSRQCLDRRVPDSRPSKPRSRPGRSGATPPGGEIDWRFTTEDARIKLKRLYPSLQE